MSLYMQECIDHLNKFLNIKAYVGMALHAYRCIHLYLLSEF